MKLATKSKRKQTRWTRNQFIVWAFNFIVGYGFVITLNGTFQSIGNFLPIILIIGAIISFISGYSYVRLSRSFVGDGGAFLYAQNNIKNRFIQYSTGFWQYIQGPTVGVASFFGIMWAFSNIFSSSSHSSASKDIAQYWYVSFFTAILFGLIFIMLTKGFMMKKYVLYFMYFLKWSMLLLALFIALASLKGFAMNVFHNSIGSHSGTGKKISDLNIITGVISFFFAFGGFEGVAVVGSDVENSKKNLGRTLIICLILTALAYIVMWFILIGSIGVASPKHLGFGGINDFNPLNVLLGKLLKGPHPHGIVIGERAGAGLIFVLALLLLSEIANKSSSRFMNGGVNARILVVLARSGFLPKGFLTKNRNKQYINALGVDFFLIYFIFIIFYIIYLKTEFKLTDVLDLYTILTFLQYIFVFYMAIKFYVVHGRKKWHKLEIFGYIFGALVLAFFLLIYEMLGIINLITALKQHVSEPSNYGTLVIACTMLIIFCFSIILYGLGKCCKWHKHAQNFSGKEHYSMVIS